MIEGAAVAREREAVSMLWHNINDILSSSNARAAADASLQHLATALPDVDMLETQELSRLAQLHTSSASNLMATIKLLVPSAFPQGCSSPNMAVLCQENSTVLAMVTALIDLQLFSMQRAAVLTFHIRQRLRQQRERQAADEEQDSSCSSCTTYALAL